MDILLRIALLLFIMAAFLIIYQVWLKIKDVDFKRLEIEVCEVLKMKNPTQDCRDRCCNDCPNKDTCNGNATCKYCQKTKDVAPHPDGDGAAEPTNDNEDGRF